MLCKSSKMRPGIPAYSYFGHFHLSSLYSYTFFSFTKNRFKWPTRLLGLRPHCKIPYITSVSHVRESNQILDSEFDAVDSGFHALDAKFLSVEREFQIPIVIRRITDSNSKRKKFPDFPFHKQKSGIQMSLYWAMYSFIGSLGMKRSVELNLGERKGTSLIWRLKIYSGIHHVKIAHFLSIFIQENN